MSELDYIKKINEAFPKIAWAYAVMCHKVAIGAWENGALNFHSTVDFNWENIIELRVFNSERELRFIRGEDDKLLLRDSDAIAADCEKRDTAYLMYGTSAHAEGDWTLLKEDRGGELYFPKGLEFENNQVVMWLGIRNYLRFTEDLRLEVFDYAFTGFMRGLNEKGTYKDKIPLSIYSDVLTISIRNASISGEVEL